MIDTGVTFVKNLVFLKTKTGKLAIVFSAIKCVCMIIFGMEGVVTLIAFALEVAGVLVLVFLKEQYVRCHGLVKSVYWIFYDATHGAFVAAIMGIGSVIAISVSIYQNRQNKTMSSGQ